MRRRRRSWWHAAVAAAALLPPRAGAADQPVHDSQMAATQYAFEPATIEVTAGESVRLGIRSRDVVHGFAIPDLKIEARIPAGGEAVTVEFIAPPPGHYDIACSEYCGAGHGQMKASLVSVAATGAPADASPPARPADEDMNLRPAEPDFTLI